MSNDPATSAHADDDERSPLRVLFETALQQPPDARAEWIRAHGGDPGQQQWLQRLLDADASAAGALDTPACERALRIGEVEAPAPDSLLGQRIGAFRLLRLLGQGGMATVFLGARADVDFVQQAAIKLLRRGLYSDAERRLFRRERQALAMLSHPHIAHLIDGGITDAGIPYLVMDYVDGMPITDFAATHRLELDARLQLFVQVCDAVAAAHRALIVHRDIKPSNILVTADGTPRLLDFGIAKLLDDDDDGTTRTGMAALTPDYAAPEQLGGGPITTATDVYALGVLLHELLLGIRPAHADPRRPSARASELTLDGTGLALPQATLRHALRGDLDNILLKALAADPERRYASADALAEDIGRHLQAQPVAAHPPSNWYRTRKFVQRHRGSVALTLVFVLGLLGSLGIAVWQAQVARQQAMRAHQQALEARSQAQRANAVRDFVEDLFQPVDEGLAESRQPTVKQLVAAGVDKLQANTELGAPERVDLLMMFARLHEKIGEPERARVLGVDADALARRALAPASDAAIAALVLHGHQAVNAGDYADGEKWLLEARGRIDKRGDAGGQDAPLIDVLDTLAEVAMDRGDAARSLALERRALAERQRQYGPDARELATGYNNLGYGLVGVGRFQEAIDAYRRTYEIDRKYRDPESYDVLSSLSNWGWAVTRAGHMREGRALLARADAGLARLGGKPRMMHVINSEKLCSVDTLVSPPAVAAASCARMRNTVAAVTGDSGIFYGFSLRIDAARLLEAGDLERAASLLDRAWRQFPGPENGDGRAGVLEGRADVAWLRGDPAGARDAAFAALPLMRDHSQAIPRLGMLAIAALACQQVPAPTCSSTQASDLQRALADHAGESDPRLLLPRLARARLQLARGDNAMATASIDAAIQRLHGQLDPTHPLDAVAHTWHAYALAQAGLCSQARHERDAADAAAHKVGRERYPWLVEAGRAFARDPHCRAGIPMPTT